jgi:hypothetical protein
VRDAPQSIRDRLFIRPLPFLGFMAFRDLDSWRWWFYVFFVETLPPYRRPGQQLPSGLYHTGGSVWPGDAPLLGRHSVYMRHQGVWCASSAAIGNDGTREDVHPGLAGDLIARTCIQGA